MNRQAYPSDLSDDEWELVKPLIPVHQGVGHPQTVDLKEILNAIFYWADHGIKWRAMPHDFPSWSTAGERGKEFPEFVAFGFSDFSPKEGSGHFMCLINHH